MSTYCFSSAKDPVNMAGFMIDNIANGILKQWHLSDLTSILQDSNATLLDVRTISEYTWSVLKALKTFLLMSSEIIYQKLKRI